jgi:hypothetical protein
MTHRGVPILLSNGLKGTLYCHSSRNRKQLRQIFWRGVRKIYPTQIMLPGSPTNYFIIEVQMDQTPFHLVCYDNDGAVHLHSELAKDVTVLYKKYLDTIVYADVAGAKTEQEGKMLLTALIKKTSPPILPLLNLGPRAMKNL